jgi:hypothetical protein
MTNQPAPRAPVAKLVGPSNGPKSAMKKTTLAGILSLLIAAPATGAEITRHNVPFIGDVIAIAGVLELGDDQKFDTATSNNLPPPILPPPATVDLNSSGGHNDPAIKIGQTVRARVMRPSCATAPSATLRACSFGCRA